MLGGYSGPTSPRSQTPRSSRLSSHQDSHQQTPRHAPRPRTGASRVEGKDVGEAMREVLRSSLGQVQDGKLASGESGPRVEMGEKEEILAEGWRM